jgi:hypothetical protein
MRSKLLVEAEAALAEANNKMLAVVAADPAAEIGLLFDLLSGLSILYYGGRLPALHAQIASLIDEQAGQVLRDAEAFLNACDHDSEFTVNAITDLEV